MPVFLDQTRSRRFGVGRVGWSNTAPMRRIVVLAVVCVQLFLSAGFAIAQTESDASAETFLLSFDLSDGIQSIVQAGRTLDALVAEVAQFKPNFEVFFANMGQYGFEPGLALAVLLGGVLVASLAEWALRSVFARAAPPSGATGTPRPHGWPIWRVAAEVSALFTFGLLVFLPALILLRTDPVSTAILTATLQAALLIRAAEAVLRHFLGPSALEGHMSTISVTGARRLYLWFVLVACFAAIAFVSSRLFEQGGLAPMTLLSFTFLSRALVSLTLLIAIFANRQTITQIFQQRRDGSPRSEAWLRFAAIWHILAASYIVLSFLGTSFMLLTGVSVANLAALMSFLVLLLAMASALWLDSAMWIPPAEDGLVRPRSLLREVASRIGVPSIAGAVVIALVGIWSPLWSDVPILRTSAGARSAILQIAVISYLTFILWQVVNSVADFYGRTGTDRPDPAEAQAGVQSRFGTLIPLAKIALLVGLVLVSTISILSAIGVDVLPLFAGAGIIGLAIGLGSQTLVKDVVSGIFFLIDDAFRIGEYVDLGFAKGTVESISIRSMRLRHHLGTVHTVPYGNITTVANMSRDWVIMRVEFRVPFDVDTEELRKKIKALGQELMADPEIGPKFLEPLKSNGVVGIEEAAMIIRCKYTAKPGNQWELRRRVYEEIRRLFEREGISIAVRQVHVSAPGDATPGTSRGGVGGEAAFEAASPGSATRE